VWRLGDYVLHRISRSTYITFNEPKAVRCAIKAFLPELKGMRLLLREDNQYVIEVLTHLPSKSPAMMC
jgi:hypothetical protein